MSVNVPYGSTGWKYLNEDDAGIPVGWETVGFDDSSWGAGQGGLAHSTAPVGLFTTPFTDGISGEPGSEAGQNTDVGAPIGTTPPPLGHDGNLLLRRLMDPGTGIFVIYDVQPDYSDVYVNGDLVSSGSTGVHHVRSFSVPDQTEPWLLAIHVVQGNGWGFVGLDVQVTGTDVEPEPEPEPAPVAVTGGATADSCTLGCCTDTQVDFNYRCGAPNLFRTEDISDASYGRVINDASTAQVTIATESDCCEDLGNLRTWCHEVAIYRCGMLQWSGPVSKITYTPSAVVVEAVDIIGWLDALPFLVTPTFVLDGDGFIDVTEMASQLIEQNTVGDTTAAGCMIMDVRPSGLSLIEDPEILGLDELGEFETVGAALRSISDTYGLNFTALGRKLVLFGTTPLSLLDTLTDEDFAGEVAVVEDGADATTLAVVTGGFDPQIVSVDGVCGVVGRVVHLDNPDADDTDGLALAQRIVDGGYPTPLRVEIPAGAALSPDAPICLETLVPGVNMRVMSNQTCRQATDDLRLTSVEVQVGPDSESVQITLESPGLVSVA